jgi:hypothetical protein
VLDGEDAMGDAGVVDESFFRRYRELCDAEDSAFDELEHAYEDGDREHWADDFAAWKAQVEKRTAFLTKHGFVAAAPAPAS